MSEFAGGIDEEIGVEEKEKSDKITSIEEKKPKRRPFHYWEVGDRKLSLKLNTRMIEILENKYKMNIINLVAGGDIPPLSVMITVVQAAAAPWTHKLKYEDVQKLYDKWTEDGGDQITFYTLVSDDLDELYEQALDCGIRPALFWELSPLEVADLMASYHRKERRKFKQQVGLSFLQAEVTARYVSLQKGDPLPEPWEYYPTLFEEEKQAFEQEKLKEYYEKRREDAARYNQRRHQMEEN